MLQIDHESVIFFYTEANNISYHVNFILLYNISLYICIYSYRY